MKRDARYLYHVNLATGRTRRSYQQEAPLAVAACSQLLEDTAQGVPRPAPGLRGCEITINAEGRCLVATIWTVGQPLVRLAIAESERCGSAVWKMLHNTAGAAAVTSSDKQPRAPWVATIPLAGLAHHNLDAGKLAELERDIGWAFLARIETHRQPRPAIAYADCRERVIGWMKTEFAQELAQGLEQHTGKSILKGFPVYSRQIGDRLGTSAENAAEFIARALNELGGYQ